MSKLDLLAEKAKYGAKSMSVQVIDLSEPVDFGKMFAGTIRQGR
jgi:hypothetical protein